MSVSSHVFGRWSTRRSGRSSSQRPPRAHRALRKVLDLDDFERVVRPRLPSAVYGYVAHGSETESTLRSNRTAFDDWELVTRVLVGVHSVDEIGRDKLLDVHKT